MEKELQINDIICTEYSVEKIISINDDIITLESIYVDQADVYKRDVEKHLLLLLIKPTYNGIITVLLNLHNNTSNKYKHVIVDIKNNVAISKIPKSEFQDKTSGMSTKSYISFYKKNVKLLFTGDVNDTDTVDTTLIKIDDDFSDFMVDMGFFLWGDFSLETFGNAIDYFKIVQKKYNQMDES
jgi:hypothetical protein